MQCPSCSKTFAATLSVCPSCGKMPTQHSGSLYCPLPEKKTTAQLLAAAAENEKNIDTARLEEPPTFVEETPRTAAKSSTLIEFPKRKNNEAEWRDALRERVRAARERREGGEETEKPKENKISAGKQKAEAAPATVINLKSNSEPKSNFEERPASNLKARALERVERSRQVHQSGAAAVALAPVFEPQEMPAPRLQVTQKPSVVPFAAPQTDAETISKSKLPAPIENAKFDVLPISESAPVFKAEATMNSFEKVEVSAAAVSPLVTNAPAAPKKEPRKLAMISDADADKFIESQMRVSAAAPQKKPSPRSGVAVEQEIAPRPRDAESIQPEITEDYAPLSLRFVAAALDIALCAGATLGLVELFAPAGFFDGEKFGFGNVLTVLAVFAALKFVYLTAAIVLAETTFAGRLFSLRTVHAEDGSAATILEAMLNTLGYLLTLALAGVGFIAIFFSTERRAAHDWLSGTVVIREN